MALTITHGPSDWSIGAENGRRWAEWKWSGHPTIAGTPEHWILWEVTKNGEVMEKEIVGDCQAPSGEHLSKFDVGTYTMRMYLIQDLSRRNLTDDDRTYIDAGENPPDFLIGEQIIQTSNDWNFTVSA